VLGFVDQPIAMMLSQPLDASDAERQLEGRTIVLAYE